MDRLTGDSFYFPLFCSSCFFCSSTYTIRILIFMSHDKDTTMSADVLTQDTDGISRNLSVDKFGLEETTRRLMDALFKSSGWVGTSKIGELVSGKVLSRRGPYIYIDLGACGTGVIYCREFYNARDIIKTLKTGSAVTAKVIEIENEDGYMELSLCEAGKDKMWQEAEALMKSKTPVPLLVVSANKGGLVMNWQGVSGFLPVSQLTAKHYPRVEGGDKGKILNELQRFVGETLEVIILDIDSKESKLIFSEKNVESDELKEALSKYQMGDVVEGEVTGVVEFGIFIKIEEGLEGLAHISELDWGLVESPANLFKIGEKIKAKIISIEGDKISLSVKALKPDPWELGKDKYNKGDIVEGKVLRLNKFGALVLLGDSGIYGLAHISEFGTEKRMRELVETGKSYVFQIAVFHPEDRKLSLSFLGKDGAAPSNPPAPEAKKEE